jgi:hypothetical protein
MLNLKMERNEIQNFYLRMCFNLLKNLNLENSICFYVSKVFLLFFFCFKLIFFFMFSDYFDVLMSKIFRKKLF